MELFNLVWTVLSSPALLASSVFGGLTIYVCCPPLRYEELD